MASLHRKPSYIICSLEKMINGFCIKMAEFIMMSRRGIRLMRESELRYMLMPSDSPKESIDINYLYHGLMSKAKSEHIMPTAH